MERVILWSWCWKKRRQYQPESPRRAGLARLAAVLTSLSFERRFTSFVMTRASLSRTTVLASSCFVQPTSPFQSPGSAPQPCPSPGRGDERRSRPGGCGRKRDSRRTARIRGGVVESMPSASVARVRLSPGGMKGRGAVGEARHVKHRSAARSADCDARVERAEGFRVVCGITPTAVVRSPTNRYVPHLY